MACRPRTAQIAVLILSGCTCTTSTLRGLEEKGPISEPEIVCVRAVYRGAAECGPCPPEALCQPCLSAILLAETAATPPERFVWVFGTAAGLIDGKLYTFEIGLRPGYAKQLHARDNNPVYYDGPPPLELRAVRD